MDLVVMTNDEGMTKIRITERLPWWVVSSFEHFFFLCPAAFAPRHFLVAILIFYPAVSFAQERKVKLNESGFAYAKELIARGNVVVDKKNEWGGHHPTTQEENEFIRTHGIAEYANWHLGIDATHVQNGKARYKFPFGDFKNIHRCALLALKSRAHQFGYAEIENAAVRLLEVLESRKDAATCTEHRRLVCAASGVALR